VLIEEILRDPVHQIERNDCNAKRHDGQYWVDQLENGSAAKQGIAKRSAAKSSNDWHGHCS
jgi:hypothetical protein